MQQYRMLKFLNKLNHLVAIWNRQLHLPTRWFGNTMICSIIHWLNDIPFFFFFSVYTGNSLILNLFFIELVVLSQFGIRLFLFLFFYFYHAFSLDKKVSNVLPFLLCIGWLLQFCLIWWVPSMFIMLISLILIGWSCGSLSHLILCYFY